MSTVNGSAKRIRNGHTTEFATPERERQAERRARAGEREPGQDPAQREQRERVQHEDQGQAAEQADGHAA